MADVTVDELGNETLSVWDRAMDFCFPARRRRRQHERVIQRKFDRVAETVNGIKQDHGLDDLMIDIERARAQGEAAMEATPNDQEEADEQKPEAQRRISP